MERVRTWSLAAAVGAGSVGTAGGAYRLLREQAKQARTVIGKPTSAPPRADGVYDPAGGPPSNDAPHELSLVVLGDSTAAGMGCSSPEEVPGVLLARGLTEESGRPVRLTTHAVVGATSRVLDAQVDMTLDLGGAPDAVVVLIGANDVTARLSVARSAERLSAAVARLRSVGVVVVVGTCPDLGAVRPIPQPLRSVVRTWSLQLARAQHEAVRVAGGHPVALADLLSPEFLSSPDRFFSPDQFHPSAAGYDAAAGVMLPVLCSALGVWGGGSVPVPPLRSATAEARRPTARATAALNRELQSRARAGGTAATRMLRIGGTRTGQ